MGEAQREQDGPWPVSPPTSISLNKKLKRVGWTRSDLIKGVFHMRTLVLGLSALASTVVERKPIQEPIAPILFRPKRAASLVSRRGGVQLSPAF